MSARAPGLLLFSGIVTDDSEVKRLARNARELAYQKTPRGKAKCRRAKPKYLYGITEDQYLWLLEQQGGVCEICGLPEVVTHPSTKEIKRLGVEHSHDCDQGHDPKRACIHCIRSLACYNCNIYMGRVERSPRLAARFTDYLARRPFLDASAPKKAEAEETQCLIRWKNS